MIKKISLIAVIALLIISCKKDDVVLVVIDEIRLDQTEFRIMAGETKALTATIIPENATNKTLKWNSNDESVATVSDSGIVTGTGAGRTTIIVSSTNNVQASCIVTVDQYGVLSTGITLNKTSLTLTTGGMETLTATIIPEDAVNKTLTWSSDNESVAVVSNTGAVTAIATGTATVTVTTTNNIKATCLVIVEREPDVYVAGYEKNVSNKNVAKLWKNGEELYTFTDGSNNAEAHSVYAANNNVYVAGFEGNVAKLWTNGNIELSLNDGTKPAEATSVFVSGSDVYVAGYENAGNHNESKVWKIVNNTVIKTTTLSGTTSAEANSVYVSGTDVYVAGYETNEYIPYNIAKFWKNGTATQLGSSSENANATSIYVSGTNVYVAGYKKPNTNNYIALLWTNTTAKNLTNGSKDAQAYSVCVSDNDTYVAGYEANSNGYKVAKIWKNGAEFETLTDETKWASANSIAVTGNNVYVAGYETNASNKTVAKIWKNGEEQALTDGTKDAYAMSIFVK